MMKVFVVLLFAALAYAALEADYTGYFVQSTQTSFLPTGSNSNGVATCAPGSSSYQYVSFNQTFSSSGVYYVQILAENSPYLAVYQGAFNPTAVCSGALSTYDGDEFYVSNTQDNHDDLSVTQAYYFNGGQVYTFVMFSSSGSSGPATDTSAYEYVFGVKVFSSIFTGIVTDATQTWGNPYTSSSGISQSSGSSMTPYVKYQYTATSTGFFDVGAWAVNGSSIDEPVVSFGFFQGTPNQTQIQDVTTADGTNYFPYDNNDHQGVFVFNVYMTQGSVYTFVASNYEDGEPANFGFFVMPSQASALLNPTLNTYTPPQKNSPPGGYVTAPSACQTQSSGTAQPFVAFSFTAAGSVALTLTSEDTFNEYLTNEFDGVDFASYLYRNLNNTDSRVSCPNLATGGVYVGYEDSGVVYDLNAGSSVHTLMVTPYSPSTSLPSNTGVYVYYFAGQTLNGPTASTPTPAPTSAPTPTTSTPTTSTPTTSTPTTSTPTTSTPTTSTPTTSTPTTSTPTTSTPTTSTPTTSTPTVPTPAPTPVPTLCPTVNYVGTITFTIAGGCANASIAALVKTYNTAPVTATSYTNATCVASTNGASVINLSGKACASNYNSTLFEAYVQTTFAGYGATSVTASFSIATAAPTTSTPSTSTPTSSSPSTATTSDASTVFVSVVVVISALLGLFF